jgi:hypothetical protein
MNYISVLHSNHITPTKAKPNIHLICTANVPHFPGQLEFEPMLVLANSIRDNVLILNDFLSSNCHPSPTFSADSVPSKVIIPPTSPEEVQDARSGLISSARTLLDLALGPVGILEDLNVRI